jgi:lysophospholipase L1-like esterase
LVSQLFRLREFAVSVIGKPYRSYVAIGDSLSEGLGDFTFSSDRIHNGWTDRLACIMAKEAQDSGYEFQYANLALRGSKLATIMSEQASSALNLQPDLVTVMAGSNDLLAKAEKLPDFRAKFKDGLLELLAGGCDVVVANTINPLHLRVFQPLRYRAERFSEMIADVAADMNVPVLDIFGIQDFKDLVFWAEDMVHFSGHGHIAVANRAAQLLELRYRFPELEAGELAPISRSALETLAWMKRDVLPFFHRKLKGVTSGDGLSPKHARLESYQPKLDHPNWQLVSA